MKVLDLYCGVGGASVGYARAGFEVTGVDLHPQPDYPFFAHVMDVLDIKASRHISENYDLIHASPPCQHGAAISKGTNKAKRDHRNFELGGWKAEQPEHIKHRGKVRGMRHGVNIAEDEGVYWAVYGEGGGKGTVAQWQEAMGIGWTENRKSIAESIPPLYTYWIARQFLTWELNNA